MVRVLWDASGLAKRYAPEIGSDVADAVFAIRRHLSVLMVTTFVSYAETYSILLRKHNRGDISFSSFDAARRLLRSEVVDDERFVVLDVDTLAVLDGIDLMDAHNVNSTDAAVLAAYLGYSVEHSEPGDRSILLSSDRHLLRAASAEGLEVLNPEQLSASEASDAIAAP